jgi:hypothetical protein
MALGGRRAGRAATMRVMKRVYRLRRTNSS